MKLSVSLPPDDVEFLDAYAREQGFDSRSAAVHQAVQSLRTAELEESYEQAWREWEASGDAEAWDAVVSDGIAG